MKGCRCNRSIMAIGLSITILIIVVFSSCSFLIENPDGNAVIPRSTIAGTWVGSIESYSNGPSSNYEDEFTSMDYRCTLVLNEDGTGSLQKPRENQIPLSWTIDEEYLTISFSGNSYSCPYLVDEYSLLFKQNYYASYGYYLYRFERSVIPEEKGNPASSAKLERIRVVRRPDRMIYMFNEQFNQTGMVVYAFYSDGSRKDITNKVLLSGFDSSGQWIGYGTTINVSYTEAGISKSDSIIAYVGASYEQSHQTQSRATQIDAKTPRTVKVGFQYYHRNNTTENYAPYTYSDDPYEDINGTMIYKVEEKGMAGYAENLNYAVFYYLPSGSLGFTTASEYDEASVKPPKYIHIGENLINETKTVGDSNLFVDSCRFSTWGETLFSYEKANYSGGYYCYISDEDGLYSIYSSDYSGSYGHTMFDGVDYPYFKVDSKNQLVEGTFINVIDYYWLEIITVEITPGNVSIDWPDYLWGIDHFN